MLSGRGRFTRRPVSWVESNAVNRSLGKGLPCGTARSNSADGAEQAPVLQIAPVEVEWSCDAYRMTQSFGKAGGLRYNQKVIARVRANRAPREMPGR